MTGRERIEMAFAAEGTPEFGVILCYDGIYFRDHWEQLTACPWWDQWSPEIERQMAWQRDVLQATPQDWFRVPAFPPRAERADIRIEVRTNGDVVRVNRRTGREDRLEKPQVSGWSPAGQAHSVHPARLPLRRADIDKLTPEPGSWDAAQYRADGCADLADAVWNEFGAARCPFGYVTSPLWRCYSLWGFEGLMMAIADRPDRVRYAAERLLVAALHTVREQAALGVRVIWIEECLTDMVHPDVFAALNGPLIRRLAEEIRRLDMKSIYYYCGDPKDRLEAILATGVDALGLEESKKGFSIDIAEMAAAVRGRCVLLGNLDAMQTLPRASEPELRREIARQMAAGRKNKSRFIMSIGSPVTPETPVARVQRYCIMARELGAR